MNAPPPATEVLVSPSARDRLDFVRDRLLSAPKDARATIVGHGLLGSNAAARGHASALSATFGVVRTTWPAFVAELSRLPLARRGLVRASTLTLEAVCARLARSLRGDLGDLVTVVDFPGLPRALLRTLSDLRLADVDAADAQLAKAPRGPTLARLLAAYEASLLELGLADTRTAIDAAISTLHGSQTGTPRPPTVLVDVPLVTRAEERLLRALAASGPLTVTVPAGDRRTMAVVGRALERAEALETRPARGPLGRLATYLLADDVPAEPLDLEGRVRLGSAPGESRECVEIARQIESRARAGVPFDRMAIVLRSPETYLPHVVEALRRASLPAYFARGLRRPCPSGRALLALLDCAAEGLSARRFAEYLSLGEVPRRVDEAPPPARAGTFVPADDEVTELLAERDLRGAEVEPDGEGEDGSDWEGGTIRAPYLWERVLVEAAVIGGLERWERRLAGFVTSLRQKHASYTAEGDPRADVALRDIEAATSLAAFALPLLRDLDALRQPGTFHAFIERIGSLATRALRRPERAIAVLSELHPLDAEDLVSLSEVRTLLEPRLSDVREPERGRQLGRVFVGAIEDARGLSFDTVFVPGLVEKSFPKKVLEDPLFLDEARRAVSPYLATNDDRSDDERLMLRLATGAAEEMVSYSYPRVDTDAGRPRTPSFYGLEVLRVATGHVPSHETLRRVAANASSARLGWPAPESREDAIDDAEHDLSVLAALVHEDEDKHVGAARFLLGANPHLRRALYARAYRWRRGKMVEQDGLVDVPSGTLAAAALAEHGLARRSFSPTALQHYAACPYRFYLSALLKLSPREEPSPLEELDPLQRGTLVHETQYTVLTRLRDAGLLPLDEDRLPRASELLEACLDEVAKRHEDTLCPAIPRVWEDGLSEVRADLREWLRRTAMDSVWSPTHFELSFGLVEHDEGRDAASVKEPVALACGLRVRGSIDLVETRRSDGALRATDHKTGKVRASDGDVVKGGTILQPALYALAVESLLPGRPVVGGRLYYCTSTGDYTAVDVPLDAVTRDAVTTVVSAVDDALGRGLLPAAPAKDACKYCDYRPVCGPYEEIRVRTKRDARALPLLAKVRGLA